MFIKEWFKSGNPWIWLTAGMVSISMIMVFGLLLLIASRGLGHFWPKPVIEAYYQQSEDEKIRILGKLRRSETVAAQLMREAGFNIPEYPELAERHLFKVGNRDVHGRDFQWFAQPLMTEWKYPKNVLVLERREWGDFIGYLMNIKENGKVIAEGEDAWKELYPRAARASSLFDQIEHIERFEIGRINRLMERVRLGERRLELDTSMDDEAREEAWNELQLERERLSHEYDQLNSKRLELADQMRRDSLTAETMEGRMVDISMSLIVSAFRPNDMSFLEKTRHYISNFWNFITGFPREANTEGGIFPAIFGTVIMVIIMSIVVTPLGVLAAIYLREYAKQGTFVRIIRISVNNLAGVPSIVFGVFGLGFFIYFLGGNIDQIFYPEALPAPTFGTPGLLWSSLTLALLTLPVVIVATEEGLTRIPRSIREGSLALGATKAETLWRTVIPLATPAMMTGLILAVARAAGEVAPLMLVGVVKLAPSLPVDSIFPFIHLERKFMHLGFHIFDVGFQSPNVEAARPLVYATSLVLVFIIVVLNLTAITIRNYLREKYKSQGD
ncbi:phosphate ABC transporter permease PstA [Desulfonatronovibrio magnus]|uniref:phosphate ABC transporter permease PstA n=1 Tax=Desulfonatronovibrio magnus TaxID=698827 RepID=UPI0005EB75C3|nr:phosphate ABC transporter permease PstA [Desulfonatronovibrio magnus]